MYFDGSDAFQHITNQAHTRIFMPHQFCAELPDFVRYYFINRNQYDWERNAGEEWNAHLLVQQKQGDE